jgi:hypothetical protein
MSRFFYKIVNGSFQNSFAANCGALNERISIQNGKFIFFKWRFSTVHMIVERWWAAYGRSLVVTKFEFEFI